jgi:hypothetical protein
MAPRAYWKGYLKLSLVESIAPDAEIAVFLARISARAHSFGLRKGQAGRFGRTPGECGKPLRGNRVILDDEV